MLLLKFVEITIMKTKKEIVSNWLTRYTGLEIEEFGKYILLTNFQNYVDYFAAKYGVESTSRDLAMPSASANDISIINFSMGSPNAATVMDLISAIKPKACLFLGKCGGLKKRNNLGDFILPIAAIRGDGTSNDYFPSEIPALPAFSLQRAVSSVIRSKDMDYWTGTVYTTNRRVWEHDDAFKEYLKKTRAMAIEMETATIFSVGFYNHIPTGALLLVSDQPMIASGIKTKKSDQKVTEKFVDKHLEIGIEALMEIKNRGVAVRHLRFDM
jgi:AMP nucleosidase